MTLGLLKASLSTRVGARFWAVAIHRGGWVAKQCGPPRDAAIGALPEAARAAGIRVLTGRAISSVKGSKRVTGVAICAQAGEGAVLEEINCEAVAMSGGWSPVVHLYSHCGGKLTWDEAQALAEVGDDAELDDLRLRLHLGLAEMAPLDPLKRGAGDISFVAADVDGLAGLGPYSTGDHAPGEAVDIPSIARQATRAAILMSRLSAEKR